MEELLRKIDRWVEAHREEMKADIAALVAIPSQQGEAAEGAPFGAEPARALAAALALCERYGFATRDYDHCVGAADLGSDPPRLDILAHLDVVAAGSGWDSDPFTLTERDGRLFGRGVADDKGPAVAALYAMRAVKELGLPLTGNVRLILGTAEETGSQDLPHYFRREKSAPNSFSPDAEFPVYNTEKGRCRLTLRRPLAEETGLPRVAALRGGEVLNIVPERAEALVLGLTAEEAAPLAAAAAGRLGVTLSAVPAQGGCRIEARGTSAHASTPDEGVNAATALVAALNSLPLADLPSTRALRDLALALPHGDTRGEALGIAMADDVAGPLTLSLGLLRLEGGVLSAVCDGRVPLCATEENCGGAAVRRLEGLGFQAEAEMRPAHHVPADSPFLQALLESYEAVTGEKGACLATGGGTYVHDIEGGVAFGPVMPGVRTNLHGANESIPLEDLLAGCKIFALAIARICR